MGNSLFKPGINRKGCRCVEVVRDPAAIALAYAIYKVARTPDVFAKMKAEVEEQSVMTPRNFNHF